MIEEFGPIDDFATGKEMSLIRIILLKLQQETFNVVLAHRPSMGTTDSDRNTNGFTFSDQGHDIVINKDEPLQEQLITLLHEVLHLLYRYAPEAEVEAAGLRLFDELTEEQLHFLVTYHSQLPIWILYSQQTKLR